MSVSKKAKVGGAQIERESGEGAEGGGGGERQTDRHSQGARGTYCAPPPLPPGTFHYGSKMYLRVARAQSHLFPGQPLGCTGVIALCARVHSCLQSVAD